MTMEPTISELVSKLQRPGLDMFEDRRLCDEIAQRGVDAARELLNIIPQNAVLAERLLRATLERIHDAPNLERMRNELEWRIEPTRETIVRRVCMRLAALYFPKAGQIGARLLDFAGTSADETRIDALKAAAKFEPNPILGARLIGLLGHAESDIVAETLNALPRYYGMIETEQVVRRLESLVTSGASSEIRCTAIELLGQFGDIDVFERVCLQPLQHAREQLAVQVMVGHLVKKPRNVLAITPKTFELLVKQLLEKMGYENVVAQSKGSWDDGVDVTALTTEKGVAGPVRIKMIAQCKRYALGKPVPAEVVSKMVESMKSQQAAKGVVITTSSFQTAAIELQRMHQYVELIDGRQLQMLLDTHFEGTFRIAGVGTNRFAC